MKTQDLRIGNYVQLHDRPVCILEVWDTALKTTDTNTNYAYFIDQYKPIPLTEEILLKCGFKKNSLSIYKKGLLISNEFEVFLGNIIVESKYLHQLQNLYWCLCEKELNVNIK